jgi:hypothetical protein
MQPLKPSATGLHSPLGSERRPVPALTLDFHGVDAKLRRTVTGNSIHLCLDEIGNLKPSNCIPGLLLPRKPFLEQLNQSRGHCDWPGLIAVTRENEFDFSLFNAFQLGFNSKK